MSDKACAGSAAGREHKQECCGWDEDGEVLDMETGTSVLSSVTEFVWLNPRLLAQAHQNPEQLLVYLKNYPLFTPHDHLDIISELMVDEHVQPAQIFDRGARTWAVMGAGITCQLSEGEDVVCIRLKGLSNSQCLGLPSWADGNVLEKRPLHTPSDVAETVNASPLKRIRSVALTPETAAPLSSPFPYTSPCDNLDTTDPASGLSFSNLTLSGTSITDDFIVSDIAPSSNRIAVSTPSHSSPYMAPLFPSAYPFRLVLLFALNVLIFASHDGRTVEHTVRFFSYKFGVECAKANYTSILRKLRSYTLPEYHDFVHRDITWKTFSSLQKNQADISDSPLWRSKSVTDWTLRINGGEYFKFHYFVSR